MSLSRIQPVCTRAGHICHLISLFCLLGQLSDKERVRSGICCQAPWTRRQQRPHYELSLRRNFASSQKRRECTITAS